MTQNQPHNHPDPASFELGTESEETVFITMYTAQQFPRSVSSQQYPEILPHVQQTSDLLHYTAHSQLGPDLTNKPRFSQLSSGFELLLSQKYPGMLSQLQPRNLVQLVDDAQPESNPSNDPQFSPQVQLSQSLRRKNIWKCKYGTKTGKKTTYPANQAQISPTSLGLRRSSPNLHPLNKIWTCNHILHGLITGY